jgi:hypothetical protein
MLFEDLGPAGSKVTGRQALTPSSASTSPVPVENPALEAMLMALEMHEVSLSETQTRQ